MARARRKKRHHRIAGPARRTAGKARRNYRRSSTGNGIMADVKEGAFALGGGTTYPLVMNLLMKFLPAGADGTPTVPRPLVGLAAAAILHIGGRLALGTRSIGLGAIGAYGADLNLPARFGLNEKAGIKDYLASHGRVEDYIGAQSAVGAGGTQIFLNPGLHDVNDGRNFSRQPAREVADYIV